MKIKPIARINNKVMAIHTKSGSTVCSGNNFAMKARIARLKRECQSNLRAAQYA